MWIHLRNTNATARTATLLASTTAASFVAPEWTSLGGGAGTSSNTTSLAATTGCCTIYIQNILGNILAARF
jgi:hypothetical protein